MIRSHLILNNSCCKDFVVSEGIYGHGDTKEGDAYTTRPDDVDLMAEILHKC